MNTSRNLTLDDAALARVPDSKKPLFILDWLKSLSQSLLSIQNSDVKDCQKLLVEQLTREIHNSPGPPTRKLLGKCLSTLFAVGDTFLIFETVNKCNDILKNKDDSPSFLPTKLAAICCIGIMYEKLGRLMGRSYEETVTLLLKILKSAESQLRCEIYLTLKMIVAGMGSAAGSLHRDIFKSIKHGMTDRVLAVRANAALCLNEMLNHATFLYTTELETVFSLCFRSFEGSNYEVRCRVSHVLGSLVAITQLSSHAAVGKNRLATLDEVLGLLATGFLRGGIGFLKSGAGEMIKGSVISRETRVGVTHSYVVVATLMGSAWLERNLSLFVSHLLDLLGNPKAAPSHMDAVYSRRCITFVLRFVLRRQLSEKAQANAIKELVFILNKYVSVGAAPQESTSDSSNGNKETVADPSLVQHILICALQELGCLIEDLGTSSTAVLTDQSLGLVDTVASILVHSSPAARLASAWCLRCIAVASPSQLTPLTERCLERLETMKTSPETIYGYSFALSALLGSSCQTPLGIPHNKGKLIFSIAEDLLRSASQNSRLSLQRTQSGWQLIAAVMTLGPPVVRGLLPRMLLLWKNCFPRSAKELESEKARGDAFTWQITLENRAGALAAMSSFLTFCQKLVTEETIRRLLGPVESAITMLTILSAVFRNYGPTVKASCAMVRYRLYETLLLLPPQLYDGSYTNLLRLLVAEFTLAENAANTATSLLRTFCHNDDDIILGSWLQETDHKSIEDQLQPNNTSGCGALEHDVSSLYKPLKENEYHPWSLPLGVEVINKSCLVYGHIFRFVANKHRLQMLTHFQECIKHSKGSRQEAVQMNVLTAVVSALKSLSENKASLGPEENKTTLTALLSSMLSHNNPVVRCASAQSLGRLGQIVGDGRYVANEAQLCFDKLKSSRDAHSRTGHSLALGYLHRYVGSLGSSQHLNTSISILLALSQDSSSSAVQVWALHALTLIADSGGPNFRPYVEPCLAQSLKLLTTVPFHNCDVHQCIGNLLSAVITAIGPELQADTTSVCTARSSLLLACAIMQEHSDALVQAEAISCLQQLHMFAPKHVDLCTLVPTLCNVLDDKNLFLRRAAVSCLHQLTQCEPNEVCDHVRNWMKEKKNSDLKKGTKSAFQVEHGLPGILFSLLDIETDRRLIADVHKIVTSLIQAIVGESVHQLLTLCKEVLTSTDSSSNSSTPDKDVENEHDFDDDESTFKAEEASSHPHVLPRWQTRVFATQTLCRVITCCENLPQAKLHFDLQLARERKREPGCKEDFLILHLSELIRMSFMTATSDSDPLRLEGLKALGLIIEKFSKVPEPEFPDHVVLEQYQAQVGAALRPAFSSDTPSHVTAMACQVCSAWIGSGVARDLNDLRRVHQLLVSSLTKLRKDSSSRLYNESASTLEKLAILKAWAEVYVVAMEQEEQLKSRKRHKSDESEDDSDQFSGESLLQLVKPELKSLSGFWLAALKDHALLTLPPEFSNQLPHDGGAFYTSDTIELTRPQYRNSWPPILHAAALWLCTEGFEAGEQQNDFGNKVRFHLLFGICMEALCNPKSTDPLSYVVVCLKSLETLFTHSLPRSVIGKDKRLAVELCNVLHRLLLTRETIFCQRLVLSIAQLVVRAQQEELESEKRRVQRELAPANHKVDDATSELSSLGDGGAEGSILPGESIVYSLMELCLYVLVRQLPNLSPSLANTPAIACTLQKQNDLEIENMELIGKCVQILSELPEICSPSGSVVVLPTVLYLITGVEKELWCQNDADLSDREPIVSVLAGLERLVSSNLMKNSICSQQWVELLQSALAGIVDSCKTSDGPRPNEIAAILTIKIFLTRAPRSVVLVPNLLYPCINLLKQSLESSDHSVQLSCLKTMKTIFSHDDYTVIVPYIHAMAPKLITLLGETINENCSSGVSLSKSRCEVILGGLESFESLLSVVSNDKLINLLKLYLPMLISLLSDNINNLRGKPNLTLLHRYALQKLTSMGKSYPQEFRQIIGQSNTYRQKLEAAVRSQQDINNLHNPRPATVNREQESSHTIKLKTDFSNYG